MESFATGSDMAVNIFTLKKGGEREKALNELRTIHANLKAIVEAERLLLEDPPLYDTVIAEAIQLSKDEAMEKRNANRDRLFDEVDKRLLNNNIMDSYKQIIRLFLNEIQAIRDSLDPPRDYNSKRILEGMEKDTLLSRYGSTAKKLLSQGWCIEKISNILPHIELYKTSLARGTNITITNVCNKYSIEVDQFKIALELYNEREQNILSQLDARKLKESDNYFKDRILCSDETCIGVIGHDGYCKECGKPRTKEI
jgi:hypothetical protein